MKGIDVPTSKYGGLQSRKRGKNQGNGGFTRVKRCKLQPLKRCYKGKTG